MDGSSARSVITGVVTEATPHLFKKSNFRLVRADKSKAPGIVSP